MYANQQIYTIRTLVIFSFLSICQLFMGCGGRTGQGTDNTAPQNKLHTAVSWQFPRRDTTLRLGESLTLAFNLSDSQHYDSLTLSMGNEKARRIEDRNFTVNTDSLSVGQHIFRLFTWYNGRQVNVARRITLLASHPPEKFTYNVVQTFPHNTDAYTQGLLFHNNFLYESTGQRGESSLRQVQLKTGEVLKRHHLEPHYFAEGLALHDGKLFQLTWTSQTAFVYDLETFELERTHTYGTQGWGLASNGKHLYMSDGTEKIYVRDPNSFEVIRTFQVYNENGPQRNLNELEFIDGLLYANIYMTDLIVAFDPQSGEVIREIDLTGILPRHERTVHTDVLNGIAYDPTTGTIYVTGKYWPKLYQIQLHKR